MSMVSGKKTKKSKGKTLDLASFLGGGPGAAPQGDEFAVATVKSSWADEMDDYDDSPRFSSGMQFNRHLGFRRQVKNQLQGQFQNWEATSYDTSHNF